MKRIFGVRVWEWDINSMDMAFLGGYRSATHRLFRIAHMGMDTGLRHNGVR